VLTALTALAVPETSAGAQTDAGADRERRAQVAARVGDRVVTVGELEDRLAEIPPFQLLTFGATRETITRKYLEDVVIRDLLLGVGAEQRGVAKELPWSHQLQRARASATLRALRAKAPAPNALPAEEVQRFYDENRSRFETPERINVWRILCKTSNEAAEVIAAARREPTIPKFNDLAREHSIDKATNFRGGNLGFLAADGTSNEAGLKVDPAIVAAAATVKDGELVGEPVSEAGGFAVVWRRATVPATKRSLEDATAQIRTTIYRERTEGAEKKAMADLRESQVKDVSYDLLKIVELGASDAGLTIPRSTPVLRQADAGSR
jgi:peptidyl-prolyl cis-trans isomerase C